MKKMIIAACAVFALTSCSDFLEETPVGELTPEQAQDPNNIEGLIISAYSILDGQMDDASSGLNSGCSNWQFGDVISDDTYKGGGGTGDQNPVHLMEIFHIDPTIQDYNRKWLALYEGAVTKRSVSSKAAIMIKRRPVSPRCVSCVPISIST